MDGAVLLRAPLLAMLCTYLGACGPPADLAGQSADYAERVERVMDVAGEVLPAPPPPRWPRERQARVALTETRINLLEFLALHQCDLGALVGYRNSGLGRVMVASERFAYENAITAALARCVVALDGADRADAQLWLEGKRRLLPEALWNATVAGPEIRAAWTRDVPSMDLEALQAGGVLDLVEALDRLAAAARSVQQAPLGAQELDGVERALALWGQRGVQVATRLALAVELRGALRRATSALRNARRPVCLEPRATPRARTLERIFVQFYIEGVQPALVLLVRDLEAIGEGFEHLLESWPGSGTSAIGGWVETVLTGPQSVPLVLREDIATHARAWNMLLGDCGILPGSKLAPRGR